MAKLQKSVAKRDLAKYSVFIEDTNPNSTYFVIAELPEVLTGGKNAFLITGTNYLKPTTKVLVEIIDSRGATVFLQPIDDYAEGLARIVSIEVYEDTPKGPATLTILGELVADANGVPVPEEWRGKYNVKWSKRLLIEPTRVNTSRIRLYTPPTLQVNEVLMPYREQSAKPLLALSGASGSIQGIPNTSTYTSNDNPNAISYLVSLYTGSIIFPAEVAGGMLYVGSQTFEATVLNDTFDAGSSTWNGRTPDVGPNWSAIVKDETGTPDSSYVTITGGTLNGAYDPPLFGNQIGYGNGAITPTEEYSTFTASFDVRRATTNIYSAPEYYRPWRVHFAFFVDNVTNYESGATNEMVDIQIASNTQYQGASQDDINIWVYHYYNGGLDSESFNYYTDTSTYYAGWAVGGWKKVTVYYDKAGHHLKVYISDTDGSNSQLVMDKFFASDSLPSATNKSFVIRTTSETTAEIDNLEILGAGSYYYSSSIERAVNGTTLKMLTPYHDDTNYLTFDTNQWNIQYYGTSSYITTQESRSFANVQLANLTTFSGDIARAKVYMRTANSLQNYEQIGDLLLEENELTLTQSVQLGETNIRTGYFQNQGFADTYWLGGSVTSSQYLS